MVVLEKPPGTGKRTPLRWIPSHHSWSRTSQAAELSPDASWINQHLIHCDVFRSSLRRFTAIYSAHCLEAEEDETCQRRSLVLELVYTVIWKVNHTCHTSGTIAKITDCVRAKNSRSQLQTQLITSHKFAFALAIWELIPKYSRFASQYFLAKE